MVSEVPGVLAVVPSFSEEGEIETTVRSLLSLTQVAEVVVVDDASPDGTARNAREAGARVLVNGSNLGKGRSLARALCDLPFEVLLLVDGDLAEHALEAGKLIEPVLEGEADLVIAAFGRASRKGGFGLVKGLAAWAIRRLTGRSMRSPISGQRCLTREVYEACAPFAPGFGMEVAMTIDALRAGFGVVEVETSMSHRETGRDLAGFVHRGRQFFDVLVAIATRIPGGKSCPP
ncbi:MAG: glycosyltransferase [Actinobacteria bacterium]|nr:glycosyltransferase [Actinomycetota bacterium]MBU1942377.1 glycosyltransferase [Actinomycetota bacterium]MBU2689271.1 glycosyltransferase [Actinomycetota bacterium]